MTQYSEKIINIINNSYAHPTAEDIFLQLKKEESKVVLATIYNNLNTLYKANLIRKISVEGEPDRYDKAKKHDHLLCKKCGKITDVKLKDLTKNLEKQLEEKILNYDLKIFHICSNCKKKDKNYDL